MRVLIVGGGLSGLALAEALQTAGIEYQLIEARDRFGGRILTHQHGQGAFDMGPAWFWPGQPRIAALIARLGLQRFEQYAEGALAFEDARAQVQYGRGFASMQGSWRLRGGLGCLIQSLADRLPQDRLQKNARLVALRKTDHAMLATLADGTEVVADRVVLALPPRLAAQIRFEPALPIPALAALQAVPTWMAGQAKALAVYDSAFWREAGLSGDASSRFGPMVEIHDASPADGGPFGLFGFIGVPPQGRRDLEALRQQVTAQLTRLFGPKAASPLAVYLQDWATERCTATPADLAPLSAHPDYGLPPACQGLWDNRLVLSGTEVGSEFGGFIEGALEAAEASLAQLLA